MRIISGERLAHAVDQHRPVAGIHKSAVQTLPGRAVVGRNIHPTAVLSTRIEVAVRINHEKSGLANVGRLRLNPGPHTSAASARTPSSAGRTNRTPRTPPRPAPGRSTTA